MKLITAFFRLIRWPNLFFIILTQCLFYFCILGFVVPESDAIEFLGQRQQLFLLLVSASVLIAAAGYIINDYFDLQIDVINKPERVVVDRILKRRWAIVWHLVFSITGILLSFYISYRTGNYLIGIGNFLCVILLWFYSTTFKKKLLWGNIIIAALTAWVILVVYFFAGAKLIDYHGWPNVEYPFDIRRLFKLTLVYAGFAFILSIVREVVKDVEDMDGDSRYNAHTMPISWGVPATKVFVAVWLIVLISAVTISVFYAFQSGWRWGAVYCFLVILLPLIYILKLLKTARNAHDYNKISTVVKLVMLAGILSMLFFLSIR